MTDQAARQLYDACQSVKPSWNQLGEVTRSVWRDRAKLKLAGNPRWWSIAASAPRIWGALQECMKMKDLNHEEVADILDEIGVLFTKLSGTFRPGAGGKSSGSGDGKAGKKPAGKSPAKVEAGAEEGDVTIDDVRVKLKELAASKGKEKMVEALESVGAGALADVDESQYGELVEKAQELIDEEDEAPAKKPAKKAATPKVTKKQLMDAAAALQEADKPALVKLVKKFGKPSEADADVYAEYLEAIQAAMPEEDSDLL